MSYLCLFDLYCLFGRNKVNVKIYESLHILTRDLPMIYFISHKFDRHEHRLFLISLVCLIILGGKMQIKSRSIRTVCF